MLKFELTLSKIGFDGDLNNSETLLGIMDRLPPYLQRKWTERTETIFRVGKRPCFSDLTALVQQSADAANNMFGLHLNEVPRRGTNFTVRGDELQGNEFWSSSPREDQGGPTRKSTRGRANESTRRSSHESLWDFSREDPLGNTREMTRSERLEDTRTRFDPPLGPQASCFKCPLCSCSHSLSNCKTFKGKSYQGRLDVTFQKRVCRNCLVPAITRRGVQRGEHVIDLVVRRSITRCCTHLPKWAK